MAIQVQSFQFNAFQENTFLVYDQDKNCVIIDPGCYEEQEENELFGFIELVQETPAHETTDLAGERGRKIGR